MVPDYRAVIRAVARPDQACVVIDGLTAANDLGLTLAVPARIAALVDAPLKPIKLGKQIIQFKPAAPNRLHWAGRRGTRVVQAFYWVRDVMHGGRGSTDDREQPQQTVPAMPIWTQDFLRPLLEPDDAVPETPS